jgi:hypothetical protein
MINIRKSFVKINKLENAFFLAKGEQSEVLCNTPNRLNIKKDHKTN